MRLTSGEHVEHLATILCSRVEPNGRGALSAIGLMDMIEVQGLPDGVSVLPFEAVVLSSWRRNLDPGIVIRQRVVFAHQDGGFVALTLPQPIDLTHLHLATAIVRVRQLPLRGYAQYYFVVQRETPDGGWEDMLPSAGLFVAPPGWQTTLPPGHPLHPRSAP